ncbi:hypothetical protein K435DRAFT_704851, partial [Dendrothele bispora CBS 962.96]
MEFAILLLCLFVIKAVLTRCGLQWKGGKMLCLPPGPKRWPFLGSALHMPKHYAWRTFSKWKEIYGNIIYLDVLGTPIVVINS